MLKNNPIKKSTDTIGFLFTITKTPHKMDANETKINRLSLEPLVYVSFKRYRCSIDKYNFLPQLTAVRTSYTIENVITFYFFFLEKSGTFF